MLGAITGLIPKSPSLDGFAPLPSASANEFMTMQGASMALAFGAYYTIGKRAVAKLDNEDFNAMLDKPELFSKYLNNIGQPIIDNFNYHMKTRTDGIQESILTKAYNLEERKLQENIKLYKYFLRTVFKQGGALLHELAKSLGIPVEQLIGDSDTNITIVNDPTNSNTWQDGYTPPKDQDFKPPPKETLPDVPKQTPENNKLHTISVQYPNYIYKRSGDYYRVILDKEVPYQYTGTEKEQYLRFRAILEQLKNYEIYITKTGNLKLQEVVNVAKAKTLSAKYHVMLEWYRKHFGYTPTQREGQDRGFI